LNGVGQTEKRLSSRGGDSYEWSRAKVEEKKEYARKNRELVKQKEGLRKMRLAGTKIWGGKRSHTEKGVVRCGEEKKRCELKKEKRRSYNTRDEEEKEKIRFGPRKPKTNCLRNMKATTKLQRHSAWIRKIENLRMDCCQCKRKPTRP